MGHNLITSPCILTERITLRILNLTSQLHEYMISEKTLIHSHCKSNDIYISLIYYVVTIFHMIKNYKYYEFIH